MALTTLACYFKLLSLGSKDGKFHLAKYLRFCFANLICKVQAGFFLGLKMPENVEEKIKSIIVNQLGVEESAVAPKAKFIEDLGADSLDIVELVMAMEEAFGIDIPDEEAENIRTVSDAISFVKKMGEN